MHAAVHVHTVGAEASARELIQGLRRQFVKARTDHIVRRQERQLYGRFAHGVLIGQTHAIGR